MPLHHESPVQLGEHKKTGAHMRSGRVRVRGCLEGLEGDQAELRRWELAQEGGSKIYTLSLRQCVEKTGLCEAFEYRGLCSHSVRVTRKHTWQGIEMQYRGCLCSLT